MTFIESYEAKGENQSHSFEIDRNTNQLIIKRTSSVSLMSGFAAAIPEIINGSIRTRKNEVELLFREDPKLAHVVAYSQFTEGPIIEQKFPDGAGADKGRGVDYDGVTAQRPYVAFLIIDLTKSATEYMGMKLGLEITSDDDARIKIENMVDGARYDFYVNESVTTGTNKLQFSSINLRQGEKRRLIDVDHLTALVLPAVDSIKSLKMQYNLLGSLPVEQTVESLKLDNARHNLVDCQQLFIDTNGKAQPGAIITPLNNDVLVLLLDNVTSLEINTDGTALDFLQVQEVTRGATTLH